MARALMACWLLALPPGAPAQDDWTPITDCEGGERLWTGEVGASPNVHLTDEAAYSGRRSLAVNMRDYANEGKSLRQTWATDVSDFVWSPDSRLRFWLKGSDLAQQPHGGLLLVESGGGEAGAESYWFLPLPGELYGDPEWHLYTTPEFRAAEDPGWRPDADGKLDASRIVRFVFVAQQEAPPGRNLPFTFYLDDLEATGVKPLAQEMVYTPAVVEDKPDHVTSIQRGFVGRERAHPATVTFGDVSGWRVAHSEGTIVSMVRSEEEPCHEDLRYQAKITYENQGGRDRFALLPPEPIPIAGRWNAACAWVYGNNWSWMPDPNRPPVSIWVRVVDAEGQRHRLDLGTVNFRFYGWLHKRVRDEPVGDPGHLYWGGPADGRLHLPARLEAIEVHGGTNPVPQTIYIESIAFYQDDMPLPRFRPQLIEDLPFPTTPDTILPTVAQPTRTSLRREGDAFVFTVEGDETLTYRYLPQTGTLSDLTAQVADRPPFTPCAGAGPVLLLGGREYEPTSADVERDLLDAKLQKGAVVTRWRVTSGDDSTRYTINLRAKGKSLVVDWSSDDSKAVALRLGHAEGLREPRIFRVPYLSVYSQGPHVALDGDTFFLTLLDWYSTSCSGWYMAGGVEGDRATVNGGCYYSPLTDGSRNPLFERQFINLSSRFEEVLPNIPNPPSTQRAVTSTHLYNHLGGISLDRFDLWLDMWRQYHRRGIRKVMVSHHEDAWTDGADVGQGPQEYTMCIEAAPEIGDEKMMAYCRAMREMDFYIGLYENFTDYNPLGKSWDERNAARSSSGELIRVWPPTYAIRPLKALEMALDYPRRVRDKFGTNTAYRDCHTAYPPWGQVDFQAGSPGAGKFATNFRAWGALLRDGAKAYDGPIFSEGTHHWFSAGLVDGNYAQMGIPNAADYPLLLDFDLRKLHPLEADIAMGTHWTFGRDIYHALAYTIAYGHIGFQPAGNLDEAFRYYHLIQQLQCRYVMEPVDEILYHYHGQYLTISDALKTGANESNQVLIRYANGLRLAVNCSAQSHWRIRLGSNQPNLSPCAWAAVLGNEFEAYSTETDGRRISFVRSPEYLFADAAGVERDFGEVATDGCLAIYPLEDGSREAIPVGSWTRIAITTPKLAEVLALGEEREPLQGVEAEFDGQRTVFEPVEGAVSYAVR